MNPGDKVLVFDKHPGVVRKTKTPGYPNHDTHRLVDFTIGKTNYHCHVALCDLKLIQEKVK